MTDIEVLKKLVSDSRSDDAIAFADRILAQGNARTMAQAYYLRGNAYRQRGDMRMALNSYLEAMELDPDGPAAQAYRTIQEILAFYDHDLYNP